MKIDVLGQNGFCLPWHGLAWHGIELHGIEIERKATLGKLQTTHLKRENPKPVFYRTRARYICSLYSNTH